MSSVVYDFQGNQLPFSAMRLPGYGLCGDSGCKTWSARCAGGRCEEHHKKTCSPGEHAIPTAAWADSARWKKEDERWKKEQEARKKAEEAAAWCACKGIITGSAVHSKDKCTPKYSHPVVGKKWNTRTGSYEVVIEPLVGENEVIREPVFGKVEEENVTQTLTTIAAKDDTWVIPKVTKVT